jgi:transcriptional regulator with XRE-family HTH domain
LLRICTITILLNCLPDNGYDGPMLLHDYLLKKNINQRDFAKSIDVAASTLSRWLSGDRTPRGAQALRIVSETEGKVTLADIYGHAG